jgi:hypothetical protein
MLEEVSKLQKAQSEESNEKDSVFEHTPHNEHHRTNLSFKTEEREYYEKSVTWYVIATILTAAAVTYFIIDEAFSSAIVFVLILTVLFLFGNSEPKVIEIHISDIGIHIQRRLFPYKEINFFWIINRPEADIHALYFEFGTTVKRVVCIQLHDMPDNVIRHALRDYLEENFEKEEPKHNQLCRMLRL